MRYFAVLIGKHDEVPNDSIDRVVRTTRIARKAIGTDAPAAIWRSPSRRIALIAWGDDAQVGLYRGSLVVESGPHVLAGAGYYYDSAYTSDADLLAALVDPCAADSIVARLGGVFVLCVCDGQLDRVRIWNTLASQPNVIYIATEDLIVISTRGLIASVGAYGMPRYNVPAFGPFIITDFFPADDLPFASARDMPPNTKLTASPAGLSVSFVDDAYERFGYDDAPAGDTDFDRACQILSDSLTQLNVSGTRTQLGLSGGKDSRVIAAGLKSINSDVLAAISSNWSDHPDLILGRQVAERLDFEQVPHSSIDSAPMNITAEMYIDQWQSRKLRAMDALHAYGAVGEGRVRRLKDSPGASWTTVLSAGPVHAPWSILPPRASESSILLCGTGGEVLRGGFGIKSFNYSPSEPTKTAIMGAMRTILARKEWLLKPAQKDKFLCWIEEFVDREFKASYPMAVLERLYLSVNQARRVSCGTDVYEFDPLLDNRLLRLVSQFDFKTRRDDLWHFEMIRRLAPGLELLPVAEHRWSFEADGPRAGDDEGYANRHPLRINWGKPVGNYVVFTAMTDLREFFENILLRQHRELLQECINIDVLDQFIRSRESYASANAGLFWLAHAAALILSGQWLEDKVSSDPVIVRLDALWNEIYRDLAEAIEAAATTTLAKAKFLRPAPMRSLSILEGLRLFASQPFRQRFQPQAFVLGTEPYDAARHTLSVEVQPAPAELSLKVQGSELTIQLEPRKQGTHWVVLSLGAWLDIAGSETTFSVRTRKNRGPSSGIAYVALEKFDTKDRVYPQTSLCQIGAEWSEFSIGLAASPELGRPRDQVQVWLPIGDGQGTVIFDSIEWHVQRWVAPGSPMIEAMADCGSTFSKTLEAKFRNGMKHRHVSPELLEDELRHLRISAGGIEVSFSDVMRNKDSWLKMQAAVAAEIGSGIGDAGLVLVEIYRRLYAAALAVLDLVPHGRREPGGAA